MIETSNENIKSYRIEEVSWCVLLYILRIGIDSCNVAVWTTLEITA